MEHPRRGEPGLRLLAPDPLDAWSAGQPPRPNEPWHPVHPFQPTLLLFFSLSRASTEAQLKQPNPSSSFPSFLFLLLGSASPPSEAQTHASSPVFFFLSPFSSFFPLGRFLTPSATHFSPSAHTLSLLFHLICPEATKPEILIHLLCLLLCCFIFPIKRCPLFLFP